jgi:hypothetical protein
MRRPIAARLDRLLHVTASRDDVTCCWHRLPLPARIAVRASDVMKHPGGSRETNFVFWRLLWGEQKEPTPTRDGLCTTDFVRTLFLAVSTPKLALPICSSRLRRRARGSSAPAAQTRAVPARPPLAPRLQLPPPASAREAGSGAPAPCSAFPYTLNQQTRVCRQGCALLCSARHHHACSLPHGATCSDTRCLSLHMPACKRRVTPRACSLCNRPSPCGFRRPPRPASPRCTTFA